MFNNSSWFAKNSRCVVCGYNVVVTQASVESGMDYWWYCSNKMCMHHKGEEIEDMEIPEWVVDVSTRETLQQLKVEIRALVAEFCDLYNGDLSNEAVSLLLTELRKLSAV